MSRPPRIALLLCDTPHPDVKAIWGDYTTIFTKLLAGSSRAPPSFTVDPYDVVHAQAYPTIPEEYDMIMLTGSTSSAHENEPWILRIVEYMRSIVGKVPVKIVGICFGHQIIARALGLSVERNPLGWEVGPTPLRLTDAGRRLFPALTIQQFHRDHVVGPLPEGYVLLADTEVCGNHGFSSEDGTIFAVQGHPEFTRDIMEMLVRIRGAIGILDEDVVKDVKLRMEDETHGGIIADLIWGMLQ